MQILSQLLGTAILMLSALAVAMAEDGDVRESATQQAGHAPLVITADSSGELPVPWWRDAIQTPLGIGPNVATITADESVMRALTQSPDVELINVQPQIERTEITRQQAAFDWTNFLESAWDDRSDPVGSTLTTGSVGGRFEDQFLTAGGGARKSTTSGAELEVAERMGWQANNSSFLVPNPQSTSRLELTLTQPLLAGRGECYNLRRVFEARLLADGSRAESIARIQDYLLRVHEGYWELYRARATFLQRRRAVDRATQLTESLATRVALDTSSRQLIRSRASTAQQQAELMRTASAADFAAIELRRLVGIVDYQSEVIPTQSPTVSPAFVDPATAIQTALAARPEVDKAVREIRAAGIRLGASKNELLPRLDLIAGTYVAGLAANRTLGDAFSRQFVDGRPSYSVGVAWERPAGNRAAKASVHRRQLELQEALASYESAVQTTRRDVEFSIHQVFLSYRTLGQRHDALAAAQAEADFLLDRWQTAPNSDGPAILLLDDLIAAQTRLADEEGATVLAEVDHALAQVRYLRAIGTLLQSRRTAADSMLDDSPHPIDLPSPIEIEMIDAGPITTGAQP